MVALILILASAAIGLVYLVIVMLQSAALLTP